MKFKSRPEASDWCKVALSGLIDHGDRSPGGKRAPPKRGVRNAPALPAVPRNKTYPHSLFIW